MRWYGKEEEGECSWVISGARFYAVLRWRMLRGVAGQSLGLVQNWAQVDWNKVQYLIALGYSPWWVSPTPVSSSISGTPSSCFLMSPCSMFGVHAMPSCQDVHASACSVLLTHDDSG